MDRKSPPRIETGDMLGGHALVVGAGIAGLASAAALAGHFERVTVLDRDRLPRTASTRSGTPQAHHLHFLQGGGLRALCSLFPGFDGDLERAGAVKYEYGLDFRDELIGLEPLPRRRIDLVSYSMSRPLLEHLLRERAGAIPNVSILEDHRVIRLFAAGETAGAIVEAPAGSVRSVEASLVVDASGRETLIRELLTSLGKTMPDETTFGIEAGYATATFEIPDHHTADWKGIASRASPATNGRGAVMVRIEGRRWILSLGGSHGDYPPDDEDGFLAFARSLPNPTIYDAVKSARRLGAIHRFRLPESCWRHFDRMKDLPERVVPVGDVACRFNPIYGQGMSVATQETLVLKSVLERRANRPAPFDGLSREVVAGIQSPIAAAWSIAALPDLAYPSTRGERPADLAERLAFSRRTFAAAARDPEVHRAMMLVRHLLSPPEILSDPAMAARIDAAAG